MVHENHEKHEPLLHADEVFRIQGAIFEVSRTLGIGFLEAVYQECLAHEFKLRDIPFAAQPRLRIRYKDLEVRQAYVPDFVCFDGIVVELKALRELTGNHRSQIINYLKASGLRVGLLVNFGQAPKAQVLRIVH
ncbi:MAG: GxxExxY protein [Phenylobacterium sp.]|nr:GxxExxY protein [Phenylobacterium sp.]